MLEDTVEKLPLRLCAGLERQMDVISWGRVGQGSVGVPVISLLAARDSQLQEGWLLRVWISEGFPSWA